MTHVVVVTDDGILMQHPDACALHLECPEGVYERHTDLLAESLWPSGDYPVECIRGPYNDVSGEFEDHLQQLDDDEVFTATRGFSRLPKRVS